MVEERGFTVNTPAGRRRARRDHLLRFPGCGSRLAGALARKFFHDYRPKCGLRVSPHFYTTDDELSAFLAALDEARKGGVSAPHPSAY